MPPRHSHFLKKNEKTLERKGCASNARSQDTSHAAAPFEGNELVLIPASERLQKITILPTPQ